MNNVMKLGIASLLSLLVSSQSMAAFMLNGTRYIYEEGRKNTTFEVTNQAPDTFGGQVWIDNTDQGSAVCMVPAPPFFKVAPKEKQIIRIMKTDCQLPADRESLFWLNVQEIPPKPKDVEGGVLAVAVNTRVKLIYRPKNLVEGRKNAEKALQIIRRGGETYLSNPTPYYFAVTGLKVNGHDVQINNGELAKIAQLAPGSEVSLGRQPLHGAVTVEAINDWGGTESYSLK